MLVHVQMPGARFVAPPHRWLREYRRSIKAGARPLVILQPMGPVMFVFDVSDTEVQDDAPALPLEVERPFEVRKGRIRHELALTIENATRDGVSVVSQQAGSQSAGSIRTAQTRGQLTFQVKRIPKPEYVSVPLRYEVLLNTKHSSEAQYATLAHELAHLYCGHLGTPSAKWWPDRSNASLDHREFEAESVCYIVCRRLGIDNPSDTYLAGYLRGHDEPPPISLDCVMKVAGLIEQMGREHLKPRKD